MTKDLAKSFLLDQYLIRERCPLASLGLGAQRTVIDASCEVTVSSRLSDLPLGNQRFTGTSLKLLLKSII